MFEADFFRNLCAVNDKYSRDIYHKICCVDTLQYNSVLSDCNHALSLEFHNVKALFRRAQAYKVRLFSPAYLCIVITVVWFIS